MEDIGVYINLFTDFGFKKIFGTESNKDLLIHFLNTILEGEISPIVDVEFANSEFLGKFAQDRKAIFDVYCKTDKGDRFIIELQRAEQAFFKDRSLYYATFPIQDQARKGAWNFELTPIYTVCVMDFVFNPQTDKVISYVQLRERDTHEVFSDKLKFVYIEMPKFLKQEGELQTLLDKWLYFFKYIHQFKNLPTPAHEKVFLKLFQECEIQNYSPKDAMKYRESWKEYNDYLNTMNFAKEKAKEEGIEIGVAKGIEEERKRSEAKQREQARQFALIMLKGLQSSDAEIATATQLSLEEIQELREKVQKGLL